MTCSNQLKPPIRSILFGRSSQHNPIEPDKTPNSDHKIIKVLITIKKDQRVQSTCPVSVFCYWMLKASPHYHALFRLASITGEQTCNKFIEDPNI
ncbi:hypothetical protein HanXRQr2_Chr01g0003361 [Helianthus annuus]|uniref:Uncharacterized protein n=1 Tax=Helianthus annuus TaxID=4232 RepID=A0A9K3JTT4_HELAN|nr:hypothetical protein HanXRQr2_Chr01g0003361 [Helianthus annuus]